MARDTDLADVVASESPHDWVLRHEANGASSQETLAFSDSLPCVALGDMMGCWRGSALPTGHPMDGLLQVFGWWGKSFTDADNVDPLLFQSRSGQVHAVTSRFLPVGILATRRATSPIITVLRPLWPAVRALLRTSKPMARLRMIEHRGRVSATMCYDYLPIHDVFRRVDETTVLGLMDMRGMPKPFFFLLRRHKAIADSCLGNAPAYAIPHGRIAEAITHSKHNRVGQRNSSRCQSGHRILEHSPALAVRRRMNTLAKRKAIACCVKQWRYGWIASRAKLRWSNIPSTSFRFVGPRGSDVAWFTQRRVLRSALGFLSHVDGDQLLWFAAPPMRRSNAPTFGDDTQSMGCVVPSDPAALQPAGLAFDSSRDAKA